MAHPILFFLRDLTLFKAFPSKFAPIKLIAREKLSVSCASFEVARVAAGTTVQQQIKTGIALV